MATKVKSQPKKGELNQWYELPNKTFGEWFGQYLIAYMVINAVTKDKLDRVPSGFKITNIREKDCRITYEVAFPGEKK